RLASFIKTSAHYEDYDGEDGEDGRLQDLQGCPDFMKIRVLMSALG
ncbi:hypothetical protein PF001_g33211, partial [Phytophthora fragariae]